MSGAATQLQAERLCLAANPPQSQEPQIGEQWAAGAGSLENRLCGWPMPPTWLRDGQLLSATITGRAINLDHFYYAPLPFLS